MALVDGTLSAALLAALTGVHERADAKDAFASAIKGYAAAAQLSVPGAGLVAPAGPVTGTALAPVTFVDAALDAQLAALWGSNHSRTGARDLMVQAISAYANTATAQVPPGTLTSPAGPLLGVSATLPATFDEGGLSSAIGAVWAQDNSTAFAASGLAAAISAYFKSGRLVVPGTPGFTAPLPPPAVGVGPVAGSATGSIV